MTTVPTDHKRSIKKNAVTKKVYICNDSDMADELEELQEKINWLQLRSTNNLLSKDQSDELDDLKKKEAKLKEEVRKNSILFTFRSIGRKTFDAMISEHPPTDEQRDEFKKAGGNPNNLSYNPETFSVALCNAACLEPKDFDFKEAWDSEDWNQAELASLFEAALEANNSRRTIALGNV